MTIALPPPDFQNVDVTVIPMPDGGGNSVGGKFMVTCIPENLVVQGTDTVINYRLIAPTPKGIVFAGLAKETRLRERQLSTPSISVDGKMMTFSDQNSLPGTIKITLEFKDNSLIIYDPEIGNEPIGG
jgi:hypothetical protein